MLVTITARVVRLIGVIRGVSLRHLTYVSYGNDLHRSGVFRSHDHYVVVMLSCRLILIFSVRGSVTATLGDCGSRFHLLIMRLSMSAHVDQAGSLRVVYGNIVTVMRYLARSSVHRSSRVQHFLSVLISMLTSTYFQSTFELRTTFV